MSAAFAHMQCCFCLLNHFFYAPISLGGDIAIGGGVTMPEANADSPNNKTSAKAGFKMPTVEGTIDLRSPSGGIGLVADLSPASSRAGTLRAGGTWEPYCEYYP